MDIIGRVAKLKSRLSQVLPYGHGKKREEQPQTAVRGMKEIYPVKLSAPKVDNRGPADGSYNLSFQKNSLSWAVKPMRHASAEVPQGEASMLFRGESQGVDSAELAYGLEKKGTVMKCQEKKRGVPSKGERDSP